MDKRFGTQRKCISILCVRQEVKWYRLQGDLEV